MTTGEPTVANATGPGGVSLPDRARVVVVGGGVIGTSVAYHLAHLGIRDVVLLERDRLTSGTTWHAAGLMATFGSTSETSTGLRKYTRDLYLRLEAETGLATGIRQVGLIELAVEPGRLEEYRRVAAFNRHCGVEVHEISAREVAELWPLARTDDVLAGFYIPADGRVNPVDVTMSLAKGARQQGARIIEGVPVTGFLRSAGAVAGVRTAQGDIEAEYVVNCAGMWARQLGELAGVSVPLQAAEHYYLLTEPIAEVSRDWPVLEDPASYGYFREESGGLMLGMFEPVCAPWQVDGIPEDFSFGELKPDWDRMGPFLEKTMSRIPISAQVGIRKFFCGPESFTPDLAPVLGEAPELKNYFVAAGLNSIGILTGGGIGRVLAHWIVTGRPDVDITGMNIDRLHPYQANPEYRATRTVESLGMVYATHYPGRSMRTARGAKLSPIHHRLVQQRAFFRDVSGWEGADWYAGEGSVSAGSVSAGSVSAGSVSAGSVSAGSVSACTGPAGIGPDAGELSWGRQDWYPNWEAEHRACRDGVILMDMSFMAKFAVQGREAGRELDRLSAGDVNARSGRITYTQWLNDAGKLEADVTVTKIADDDFYVVASDTAHRHALTWMRRHFADAGAHAFVTDVTSAYAQINIQGPRSRELLASVTSANVSDEAFGFRTARHIDIGFARVLAIRITYLGELGYELHIPAEQAVGVYDRLVDAGREFGLRHAGLKALSSLRMEKGYRDYGHDIDNTDTVLEAGLGFAVALDKPGGFIGRDAVLAQQAAGPLTRRLVQVLLTDPEPLMFHAEIVRRDGAEVGYIRTASYGWTLGGAVGLAMIESAGDPVDQAYLDSGEWTVQIGDRICPARLSLRPFYDPAGKRIRM
jgi:glycine cleavage system aminomethyltransferase T/glycine/D-amino acid oxidase-like deaminating enzyme